MNKAVLLSIRPKWCVKIINGEKTCEVRKTAPKLKPPFKCYIYASKGKDRLFDILRDGDMNFGEVYHGKTVFLTKPEEGFYEVQRRNVIGEFVCDKIMETRPDILSAQIKRGDFSGYATGMSVNDFMAYMGNRKLYLWHITGFKKYAQAKPLQAFDGWNAVEGHHIDIPPQSWCYVKEVS